MIKNIKIYKKEKISTNIKKQVTIILKEENPNSILAKLSDRIIFEYFDIITSSNFLELYLAENNSKIIGYAITAKKPKYLITEIYPLKFKIFFNLLINLEFLTIFNIIISILKIDLIFLKKSDVEFIENNHNLNLLAIKNSFQSKGIGGFFLKKIIKTISENNKKKHITCETYSERAANFYVKKCGFKKIGKKIRIYNNLYVLSSNID